VTAFQGRRSAIVAPISLPPPLEAIRREHVENANLGVPAHVTLLLPFVPPAQIEADTLERAASAIAQTAAFEVTFADVRTFEPGPTNEGIIWLPPEPSAPFLAMTEALVAAFPDYRPYQGIHDTVIPHLTLANASSNASANASSNASANANDNASANASANLDVPVILAAARPHLPIAQRLDAAALLIEDEAGRWRIGRELPLA
jgi:2'-5' RNA ligase